MKLMFTSMALLLLSLTVFAQDGSMDGTFGIQNGIFCPLTTTPNQNNGVRKVVIQEDGKILMGGLGTNVPNGRSVFSFIRLTSNGLFDSSFGTNGRVFVDFDTDSLATGCISGLAVQPDGKILAVGNLTYLKPYFTDSLKTTNVSDIGVVRLGGNGSVDSSFGENGRLVIDLTTYTRSKSKTGMSADSCNSFALRSDGKIVLGIYTFNNNHASPAAPNGDYDAALLQLTSNGKWDKTFSNDGFKLYPKAGSDEVVNGIAFQAENIVITGSTGLAGNNRNVLIARFTADGALDKTLRKRGYAVTDVLNKSDDLAYAMLVQPDGKILVSGSTQGQPSQIRPFLVRYTKNGSLDKTFSGDGIVYQGNGESRMYSVNLQKDGKILQVGSIYNVEFQVIRYLSNGEIDASFGYRGVGQYDMSSGSPHSTFWGSYNSAYGSALQADGKLVIAGFMHYSMVSGGNWQGNIEAGTRLLIAPTDTATQNTLGENTFAGMQISSAGDVSVKIFPNPTRNQFSLMIHSQNTATQYRARIVDATGRTIELLQNLSAGNKTEFGAAYKPGIYFLEISSGKYRKTLKLVKE